MIHTRNASKDFDLVAKNMLDLDTGPLSVLYLVHTPTRGVWVLTI